MEIKGTPIHSFFNCYWEHIKKHIATDPIHGTEQEAEQLIADSEAIVRQFSQNEPMKKYVKACLIAYVTYLEEINRGEDNGRI